MEWLETVPLPEECRTCQEEECYNCDYAGKRWYLAPEDASRIRERLLAQYVARQKRRLSDASNDW